MKNKLLISFALIGGIALAQNKHINFETGNLASVFEKAKKENKLIFVDAFTVWCGPCKYMAKTVFTNDSVADYYNTTFVNLKLDMEKGEGLEFAKKYGVHCYPMLMYIDGDGNVIHRMAGSTSAAGFIELGKNSLIPEKTYAYKKKELEKSPLNESTILQYVELLSGNCMDPSSKISDYFKNLSEQDLMKRTNWYLMRDYVYDYKSKEMQYFINNISSYEKAFGADTIESKILQLGGSYFSPYTRAEKFDKAAFEKAKSDFRNLKWPKTDDIIFSADLMIYSRFDKPKYYDLMAKSHLEKNYNNAGSLNNVAWDFYENVSDKKQLEAAVKMAKRACELENIYMNLDTYAAVLYKYGNYKEAEAIAAKAIEKAKEEKLTPEDYKETSSLLDKIKEKNKGK